MILPTLATLAVLGVLGAALIASVGRLRVELGLPRRSRRRRLPGWVASALFAPIAGAVALTLAVATEVLR